MLESAVSWSIDDQEEIVQLIGGEVIFRLNPGTSARKAKADHLYALRRRHAQFERERRSSPTDRRFWIRDDNSGRREHDVRV